MDMNKVDARPFDRLWPARHEGWKTVDRQAVLVLFDALVAVARHANLEAFQDLSGAEAVVLGASMDAPALQALAEGPVDQDFVDALRLYEAAILIDPAYADARHNLADWFVKEGDFAEARRIHRELLPLMQATGLETNPIPVKTAMAAAGRCTGEQLKAAANFCKRELACWSKWVKKPDADPEGLKRDACVAKAVSPASSMGSAASRFRSLSTSRTSAAC